MIVTFTKLLVMSTVVSNCSLSIKSDSMRLSVRESLDSILFKSEGDKEKNAISDAEANAETNKRSPASTIAIIAGVEGVTIVILLKIFAPKRHK